MRVGDEGGERACERTAHRRSHAQARGCLVRSTKPPDIPTQVPIFTNVNCQANRMGVGGCQFGLNRSKSECYRGFLGDFCDKVTCVSTYTPDLGRNGGQPFTNVNGMVYKCKYLYTNVNSCRCNR